MQKKKKKKMLDCIYPYSQNLQVSSEKGKPNLTTAGVTDTCSFSWSP